MRVLLTNNTLVHRAGTELYVRDVALELLYRGHRPVAYSTLLGPVAEELRAATVPVIQTLSSLGEPPDIIHGHHHYDTLAAAMWFPETPVVYFCHGWLPWEEAPLRFPRIQRYVAVDELCRERLVTEGGVSPDDIDVVLNFFDANRFPPRPPLPATPKRALAFGNLFTEEEDLSILRDACRQCDVELDVVGLGVGNVETNPGPLMAKYDVIFGKARAAIEAMAVGAAVVLCSAARMGPMVTTENFDSLRPLNFGIRTLSQPLTAALLAGELRRYDAADAGAVSKRVREQCELQLAVSQIVSVYERAIVTAKERSRPAQLDCDRAVASYLEQTARLHKQSELAADRARWVKRCLAAENALWKQRTEAGLPAGDLPGPATTAEDEMARLKERLAQQDAELALWQQQSASARGLAAQYEQQIAALKDDIEALKASATWRWTQGALGHSFVQRLFGRLIRSVAERPGNRTVE